MQYNLFECNIIYFIDKPLAIVWQGTCKITIRLARILQDNHWTSYNLAIYSFHVQKSSKITISAKHVLQPSDLNLLEKSEKRSQHLNAHMLGISNRKRKAKTLPNY